jgi:hypothetical protein
MLPADEQKKFSFETEGQVVWNTSNDIAIPGDTGTFFSLPDTLDLKAKMAYRLRLSWQFARRHSFSLLYAPLSIKAEGALPTDLYFYDRTFTQGTRVDALYRFNSYRLTWAFDWVNNPKILFRIGFTAKIRDAEIAVSDAAGTASKTNVGFVPLIHLAFHWRMTEKVHLITDLDALAAKQGRAEDLFVGLAWKPLPNLALKVGYRTVEGGADNDVVYNFAWLHYLVAGIKIDF